MNKKVLTLSAALLLAGSLTAVAQTVNSDGEITYRSRVVKSATLDEAISDVTTINPDYYYQLEVSDTEDELVEGLVLSADRDYATGKVYLTVKSKTDAVLSHTLWQIKVTDTSANGRVYTYVNKETGYELAYDHTKALDYWKYAAQMEEGTEPDLKELGSLFKDAAELSGCISHWGWYTTDEDSKKLDYKNVYSYFHNEADSVMILAPVPYDVANKLGLGKLFASLAQDEEKSYLVFPVKLPKDKPLPDLDNGKTLPLSIRPVAAGAKVLTADEINSMIDANGSSLSFKNGIENYKNWEDAKSKKEGKAKFTVCKPGTNEPMTFAENANPFVNEFKAYTSSDATLDPFYKEVDGGEYAGYNILLGVPRASEKDTTKYLYVSEYPYEGAVSQHIYNALKVTVEPYRDNTGKAYADYKDTPLDPVDATGARYHWKVTYYATQDSVVFEPLNASRMSSVDQQAGKRAWEAESLTNLQKRAWVNTINQASDSNESQGNAGSEKFAGVPVALYAVNFGIPSGDIAAYLTVGYADGEYGTYVNPADKAYAAEMKEEDGNPAMVTSYQAKMKMALRFNHSYENDFVPTTLADGLYFINLKNVKANKTQTENRVEDAFVVEDMKGHMVYDTQDEAQNFLHMPATQWVVKRLNCTAGDALNTNATPQVVIYNREFNENGDKLKKAAFAGQLYKSTKTGNIVVLNNKYLSEDEQTVDHHLGTALSSQDEYAFTNITAQQTSFGRFNADETTLRNTTYLLQHLQNMQADKYLSEANGYVKLADEGTEFELYRANGWYPVQNADGKTYDFAYADSTKYGYSVDGLVAPLYTTAYKLKVKDENLIDNDHKFLAITNQYKYVIATESEIENSDQLTFAVVTLKENNELDGIHAYGLLNATYYQKVADAALYDESGFLKGLTKDGSKYKKGDVVYFEEVNADQVLGKLEIENTTLYAKIADLCETTTDAFVLTNAYRPLYRTLDAEYVNNGEKVLNLTTIDEQGAAGLYEDSSSDLAKANGLNYLALENKSVGTKNVGFYVDKVAKSTEVMPQYLLAVAVDSVPEYTYCEDGLHGINPLCGHLDTVPGYVEGRYLVNFNDSIKNTIDKLTSRADAFRFNNYVRLGFVEAVHQGDSLYVMKDGNKLEDWKEAATDGSGIFLNPDFFEVKKNDGKVYDIVELDGKHNNVAFSFRETGDEENSILIESNDIYNTAAVGRFAGSWVKIHNGVPVLTQVINTNGNHNTGDTTDSWKQYSDYVSSFTSGELINQAARFNGNFETKDASTTANEAISTSDVTVAATTGAVVIKGAAGKSVVITNILGQTLTSAVVSSDNATIAVPAGIAVVAVEGEEAVKVVVK